jgi:uncharacterized protein YacL
MLVHRAHSARRGRLASAADEAAAPQRGRLVEFVRLIFVVLFAVAGYTVATRTGVQAPSRTIVGLVLGVCTGFVLGGVLGRQTVHAVDSMEREFRRVPVAEVVAGTAGLLLGVALPALLSFAIFRLPALAAWSTVSFMYVTCGYVGYRIGRTKSDELFGLIGLKPRVAGSGGDISVVDTSALIDGRVVDLAKTGFLRGDLLVHIGVLEELQRIADSSDHKRHGRGRRGLDAVAELQRIPTVQVHLVEEFAVSDVDSTLVRLARERGASLVTVDHNLAKVAQALSVTVPNLNQLAAAFRLPVSVGDEITVDLVKAGREHGQAVGYLDDGTMVVVEQAAERIGSLAPVTVRNVIQTVTGRMVFAVLR